MKRSVRPWVAAALWLAAGGEALALLRPWSEDAPAWPVGTVLVADVRGRPLEVTVVDSPFYKRTIISAFVIFGEALTEGRLIGIALAFVALFCLLWKADGGKKSGGLGTQITLLAGVWAGYGIIDILFKQLAKSGTAFSGNLLVAFSLAGILMFGYLFSQSTKWTKEGIIGGIVLGGLNFANIVTYITAHQMMKDNPTLVFAGMNIGVIVLGTLVGAMAFKEKISSINAAGISVAVCAIACLFYWPQIRGLVGM